MKKSKIQLFKKKIYKNEDPRQRTYNISNTGQVTSDLSRQVYQDLKKECRNMTKKEIKLYLEKYERKGK